MLEDWQAKDTSTHQDHVIAHVLGARALGYFVCDEAVYILLDIGFLWMIFRDGEMGLLPHPVAAAELETTEPIKDQIKADIALLLGNGDTAEQLQFIHEIASCEINEVNFFERGEQRLLLISCEAATLAIETSLATPEIQISIGAR